MPCVSLIVWLFAFRCFLHSSTGHLELRESGKGEMRQHQYLTSCFELTTATTTIHSCSATFCSHSSNMPTHILLHWLCALSLQWLCSQLVLCVAIGCNCLLSQSMISHVISCVPSFSFIFFAWCYKPIQSPLFFSWMSQAVNWHVCHFHGTWFTVVLPPSISKGGGPDAFDTHGFYALVWNTESFHAFGVPMTSVW